MMQTVELMQSSLLERRRRTALHRCLNVEDLRRAARRRIPRVMFDYIDGGAADEWWLAANASAFRDYKVASMVLRGVADVDTSVSLFGRQTAAPIGLAPTGYTSMIHPDGEGAVATAAALAGVPYALSTMGTTTIEDLARHADCDLWFQLYILRDRSATHALIDRAATNGYRVLIVTVDAAVSSIRERDLRNRFTVPPRPRMRQLPDILRRPAAWLRMQSAGETSPVNLVRATDDDAGVTDMAAAHFAKAISWDDIADVRGRWSGPMVLKGVVNPGDVERAADLNVDAVVLSNHGGRQLDSSVSPLRMLPEARARVGDRLRIFLDSGIRRGSDIAIALALGADCCFIGRAYLYGLAAAGSAGVSRALSLLKSEFQTTLELFGVRSVAELQEYAADLVRPISGDPANATVARARRSPANAPAESFGG